MKVRFNYKKTLHIWEAYTVFVLASAIAISILLSANFMPEAVAAKVNSILFPPSLVVCTFFVTMAPSAVGFLEYSPKERKELHRYLRAYIYGSACGLILLLVVQLLAVQYAVSVIGVLASLGAVVVELFGFILPFK